MSELSRAVQIGTEQVSRAYSGLANLHAVNRERKRRAAEGLGESLSELGRTIRDYGSWRDAKKAEDEERQVDDAYALGMQTGEPEKALVTLGAVRPTTAAAATLRAKRMEAATEAARQRNAARLAEAEEFHRQQSTDATIKNTEQMTNIRRGELELGKAREARLGAEPSAIDPRSPQGIEADVTKARRVAEAEAEVRSRFPSSVRDLDQLIDDPEALEKTLQLTPGSLKGKTYRFYNAALDAAKAAAAREGNTLDNAIKQLRVSIDQMNLREKDPRYRKLMAAEKALEKATRALDDFKTEVATASVRTVMNPDKIATRQRELEAAVTSAQGDVTKAEATMQPDPAATGLAMPEGLPPEVQSSWSHWSDAERQQFLDELNK